VSKLTLTQGIDRGYAWPIEDSLGNSVDLTGWSAKCQVREEDSPTAKLLANLHAYIEGSRVIVSWTAEDSVDWNFTKGFYDVVLINPSGRPAQIISAGTIFVDHSVTNVAV